MFIESTSPCSGHPDSALSAHAQARRERSRLLGALLSMTLRHVVRALAVMLSTVRASARSVASHVERG